MIGDPVLKRDKDINQKERVKAMLSLSSIKSSIYNSRPR